MAIIAMNHVSENESVLPVMFLWRLRRAVTSKGGHGRCTNARVSPVFLEGQPVIRLRWGGNR